MFGLKRFLVRTRYHDILRPGVQVIFKELDTATLYQQFTVSPKEFLLLCHMQWKHKVEDPKATLMAINEQVHWFEDVIIISHEGKRTLCILSGKYEPRFAQTFEFTTREFLCFVEFPIVAREEFATVKIVGPPAELKRLMEFMKAFGSPQEIVGVSDYSPKEQGVLSALTKKQLSVLKNAYKMGFFDHPRKRTARDIAKKLNMKHTTFLTHIRKSQNRLLEALLEE
jgi:hypothetical protein